MKEKLTDIVKVLISCEDARRGSVIYPFARVHCIFNGELKNIWFISSDRKQEELKDVRQFGRFVNKNSEIAKKLQMMDVGDSTEYDIYDKTKHKKVHQHVILENRSNIQDKTIDIAGDLLQKPYQYRNLKEFLSALQQNKEDINDIEDKISELSRLREELKAKNGTSQERSQISRTINEKIKEYRILTQQQEDLKNITIYIRKQGEMRYSLIVDPIQTRIKTSHLFDGKTIIIDGGPGTGKSTTMIHRLAYLTDTFAINEDEEKRLFNYKLNATQRSLLREAIRTHRDWMFFSPSPMLREYLASAMRKEGLVNAHQKVWDWRTYCRMVLQDYYNLISTEKGKAPFRIYYKVEPLFFQGYDIINEFTNFYLNELKDIKSKLPKLNNAGAEYKWTSIALKIAQRFDNCENFDLSGFVSLFNSLESVYSEDCKGLLKDKDNALESLATEIRELLEKNEDTKRDIEDILGLTEETPDAEDETDAEGADFPDNLYGNLTQEQLELQKGIQAWLKAYCYGRITGNTKLTNVQELMSEIIVPILGEEFDNSIKKIGELMLFEHFAIYTRGVKVNMLNGLPAKYKRFRNYLSINKYPGCNLTVLRDITKNKQGKELHCQEQSLLLGFINNVVKLIKGSTNPNLKHVYIDAYDAVSRPIIGIDEATDFCVCDIYAMQSLLSREISSLTLCGDMMQRLTPYGIKDWSELEGVLPNHVMVSMKTSYRQSKKLLEVAKLIYEDTLHQSPRYIANMKTKKVPAPLAYVDENEGKKIEWISKRISEVYRAYGEQMPSIAIFVNDKGEIRRFMPNLEATEFFVKNKVKVMDGTDVNSQTAESHICVYPIDVVKGMEFDVVFFHDIDNFSVDTEMMKRFVYVGVSRAAFFLGITLSQNVKEITKYFEQDKDWFKI